MFKSRIFKNNSVFQDFQGWYGLYRNLEKNVFFPAEVKIGKTSGNVIVFILYPIL